jgi:hypothetical protein
VPEFLKGGIGGGRMIHREDIDRYPGTLTDLAREIGDLRYDSLAAFLRELATKLERDSAADAGRGRPKLAATLNEAADSVTAAAAAIERAWSISSPHM